MMDLWYEEGVAPPEDQLDEPGCNWADHDYYWDLGYEKCPMCDEFLDDLLDGA